MARFQHRTTRTPLPTPQEACDRLERDHRERGDLAGLRDILREFSLASYGFPGDRDYQLAVEAERRLEALDREHPEVKAAFEARVAAKHAEERERMEALRKSTNGWMEH